MRKRIIGDESRGLSTSDLPWLDLNALTQVRITSEDMAHPIEAALLPGAESGWRAAVSGPQTVRLCFDQPLTIKRVHLEFREEDVARTQQFVLRCSSNGGKSYREIVRQQYNFSPPGTSHESEDYSVDLDGVTTIELNTVADTSGGTTRASLAMLRLA